jgi:hypothetical protein
VAAASIASVCATSRFVSGVTGYPSDATENAVQPDIVAAGYGKSHRGDGCARCAPRWRRNPKRDFDRYDYLIMI